MSRGDFDLEALARYLHLKLAQVTRMAERGLVPGRKVGGQWRFNRSEIHHWLEERIGAAEAGDLEHLESALHRAAEHEPQPAESRIAELLAPEAIRLPLHARTRNSVLQEMVQAAADTGWLWDAPAMIEAVRARENLHSTALDNGVALLHPRRPLPDILAQPLLALGRTAQGIPFGQSQLTDVFFLICSRDDAGHLRTLARLSRLIAQPPFLEAIRAADDPRALHARLAELEDALPAPQPSS